MLLPIIRQENDLGKHTAIAGDSDFSAKTRPRYLVDCEISKAEGLGRSKNDQSLDWSFLYC